MARQYTQAMEALLFIADEIDRAKHMKRRASCVRTLSARVAERRQIT
jgi:hypothetical protein